MKTAKQRLEANLARARRRVAALPSSIRGDRSYAIHLGGTRIQFTCKRAGHQRVIDYSKGPIQKRLSPEACKMMASWWSSEKGGCLDICPKCEKDGLR